MTKDDTFKIVYCLKAVYPNAFSNFTIEDCENMVSAWLMLLGDYEYSAVSTAVKVYMTTNTSQFPPKPAQIIEIIQGFGQQEQLNANEAWALVYKAICNSAYNAQAEFEKLPPVVQKAVGSADSLKAMAMDSDFNFGVEQSHFAKAYTIAQEREKEVAKLPQSLRTAIQGMDVKRIAG